MDHHFQINLRGIIELLANHLYSRPEVFVRELLQNGVDAITARLKLDPAHQGEISFELAAPRGKPPTLVVTDNGVGMNEAEVHRFLATIGESSKRAADGSKIEDYLGQFGIGLLSCFVVSDEIVLVTKSARDDSPAVEWRGRADGSYGVRTLTGEHAPGTQVYLACREASRELFRGDRLRELVLHYGGLLPYPISVTSGRSSQVVNRDGAPWRKAYRNERERTEELLRFGNQVLGGTFLDAIPLRSAAGGADGVAFVLSHSANLAAKRAHRVYLKNMLLSEEADNLLPDWAFFVKAVVNVENLRPTASRESFYEDDRLAATRDELGHCLRQHLIELAERDRPRLARFLDVHHLAIKALAQEDDECYRTFIDWLPFETSQGRKTIEEIRRSEATIRFLTDVGEFHQVAKVAASQGTLLVNGGYVYEADLLARLPEFFDDVRVEQVDPAALAQSFEELSLAEQDRIENLLAVATRVLRPLKCVPEVRKFQPAEIAALFSAGQEARFQRSLEQAQETADPLFAGVLGALQGKERGVASAQLCLNYNNPLILRLAAVPDAGAVRRCLEVLYVQSLLLAQQPLTTRELGLLSQGILGLVEWAVPKAEEAP
ncbi:MAG: HSP90 family protein [Pirellulaceae bacterium]|nr:HSP90 family protein [Pirellulaceae bacterium]